MTDKPLSEKKLSELPNITPYGKYGFPYISTDNLRKWFIEIIKNCSAYKTILTSRKVDIGYTNEEVTGKVFCVDSKIEDKCDVCKLLIERGEINEEELK
jgi:hypothetical protein